MCAFAPGADHRRTIQHHLRNHPFGPRDDARSPNHFSGRAAFRGRIYSPGRKIRLPARCGERRTRGNPHTRGSDGRAASSVVRRIAASRITNGTVAFPPRQFDLPFATRDAIKESGACPEPKTKVAVLPAPPGGDAAYAARCITIMSISSV